MNVGEKIRSLRHAKLMTQSELAGTQITRNMLSCIENGTAQPSLPTVVYLAGRLGVSVGYLLAEEDENFFYRKMNAIENIKKAFRERDWFGCRSLCLSVSDSMDDELTMLLALSDLGIAEAMFWCGKLHEACRYFDEALDYAEKTVYPLPQIEATANVYFRCMQRISPTLYSENLDDSAPQTVLLHTPFEAYVTALEALDEENFSAVERFFETNGQAVFFAPHLRARYHLKKGNAATAKPILKGLLDAEDPLLNEVQLYAVLTDLEIACRETEDYKGAYRYANERIQLHEQLLQN